EKRTEQRVNALERVEVIPDRNLRQFTCFRIGVQHTSLPGNTRKRKAQLIQGAVKSVRPRATKVLRPFGKDGSPLRQQSQIGKGHLAGVGKYSERGPEIVEQIAEEKVFPLAQPLIDAG